MKSAVDNWTDIARSWLFPLRCTLCGAPGSDGLDLCTECRAELPFNRHCCPRCALPLPEETGDSICGVCQKHPPLFDRCRAPLRYDYPLNHLIGHLKFRRKLQLARLLGTLLAEHVAASPLLPQLLIPVPLHSARLRERGYNQALELARPVAQRLKLPVDTTLCSRVRHTAAQSELHLKQRRRNVRGAFQVNDRLRATHVAIVDDVVTSGHTVNEMARLLRSAGAERIEIWACARAARRR